MAIETARRIASDVLKVGENKIRFKASEVSKAAEALTRDDVRSLIATGAIYSLPKMGVSRARGRKKHVQKTLGRRRGLGSRKGTKYSKVSRKDEWMQKVRAQRKYLASVASKLANADRRKVYLMIKGRAFKGKGAVAVYLKDNKMLK